MRWIFLSLLLANIGFYIWHSVESSRKARYEEMNATASASSATMTGRPLLLVSNLSDQEKADLDQRAKTVIASVSAPVLPLEKTAAVVEGDTSTIKSEEAQTDVPLVAGAGQCLLIGPVSDKEYDQIAQRLLARAIVPERRLVNAEGVTEYWVVLPPFEDKNDAVKKLQELQGRGVNGQIIPAGKLANAISFGPIYSSKREADTFANQMRAKGVKVEIETLPQVREEKWLALSERQTPKLTQDIWQSIEVDFPRLGKKVQACN